MQDGEDKYRLDIIFINHEKYAVREIGQNRPPDGPPDDRKLVGCGHNSVEYAANRLQKHALEIWRFREISVGCFLQIQFCFGLNDECRFH